MPGLEFGSLVALLRSELGWTQSQLGENAEIEKDTLSNIERGAKKHLDPDLLLRLANALQLTSLERREFFLASCGLDEKEIVRQPSLATPTDASNHKELLAKLGGIMAQMYAPALLGDVYGDVIAVNNILLETLQVDANVLKALVRSGARVNDLQIAFDPRFESALDDQRNEIGISLLRAFREGSLRYRTRHRYTELMQEYRNVRKYPSFDRNWRRVSTIEEDKEGTLDALEMRHDTYGALRFTVSSSVTLTSYGELFLSHYFPLDHHTASTVIRIAEKVGNEVLFLSPWPQKVSLKEDRRSPVHIESDIKGQPMRPHPGGPQSSCIPGGLAGARQMQPREITLSLHASRRAGRFSK